MEFDDLHAFTQIVKDGTLALAAQNLYVSQGTVSQRLKRLEKELGISLIYRQQGIKHIELTPQGRDFLPLAHQWLSLQEEAYKLKDDRKQTELKLASTASNNAILLSYVYPYFSNHYPDINLYIQTEHSYEIHQMIQGQELDLGFVNSLHQFSAVAARPLWEEDLVLLVHQDNPYLETENLKDLDASKEIRITYPSDILTWHARTFSTEKPFATIGDSHLIEPFILYPQTWGLVNHSLADVLCQKHQTLRQIPFRQDPPPKRTCFLITNRMPKPWKQEALDTFLEVVLQNARLNPALTLL